MGEISAYSKKTLSKLKKDGKNCKSNQRDKEKQHKEKQQI